MINSKKSHVFSEFWQ